MNENPAASDWSSTRGEKWLAQLAGMEAMMTPVDDPLIQALRLDTTTYQGTLTFSAEAAPDRLNGKADLALIADGDARCHRRIAGDLHVKFPLVGGTAERRIVPGLLIRLDVEAAALAERVDAAGPGS